jgi:hypothetical protein
MAFLAVQGDVVLAVADGLRNGPVRVQFTP